MKIILEKISLLGLSFMLVSTFAISPLLPEMTAAYTAAGISLNQIDFLLSVPSFMIIAVLLASPYLSRFLTEKLIFVLGLLCISLGGSLPALTQDYPLVLMSRLVLGLGIGLINERAITIISQHYSGSERAKMLGIRGSTEVLGSATLTFLAGQLLRGSWSSGFLIYLLSLPLLGFYLLFGNAKSDDKSKVANHPKKAKTDLSARQVWHIVFMALYAGSVILINTGITIRLPMLVEELKLGTAIDSSLILSLMMLMGILAGTLFASLMAHFRQFLQPLVLLALALGLVLIWLAPNLVFLAIGALTTGFVYSIGVTSVFHRLSEILRTNQLALGTTLVLLGCNLGGGMAASVVSFLSAMSGSNSNLFLTLAILCFIAGLVLLLPLLVKRQPDRAI